MIFMEDIFVKPNLELSDRTVELYDPAGNFVCKTNNLIVINDILLQIKRHYKEKDDQTGLSGYCFKWKEVIGIDDEGNDRVVEHTVNINKYGHTAEPGLGGLLSKQLHELYS